MRLQKFLAATFAVHAVLAVGIATHARVTGRRAGRWPYATLVLGVFGAAGYVLADEDRDRDRA